jgi:D-glycero-alpha-D-manno-heptose-7-phosphate kinase
MFIRAHAPVRTADLGGWTDTWFSQRGTVCSIAVAPGVEVVIEIGQTDASRGVTLAVGEAQWSGSLDSIPADVDRLLWAALQNGRCDTLNGSYVRVGSTIPPASGLGTSASVVVALLAALDHLRAYERSNCELAAGEMIFTHEDRAVLAKRAHSVETSLSLQSGVQDQCAAAFGGIALYQFDYPDLVRVDRVASESLMRTLSQRLVTVYLGSPHVSSAVHESVIAHLENTNAEPLLQPLRDAATNGYNALIRDDLDEFGLSMQKNCLAQDELGPGLVCEEARALITLAASLGARGWKVNGAGGEGGSVAILGPSDDEEHGALINVITANARWTIVECQLSTEGVRSTLSPHKLEGRFA